MLTKRTEGSNEQIPHECPLPASAPSTRPYAFGLEACLSPLPEASSIFPQRPSARLGTTRSGCLDFATANLPQQGWAQPGQDSACPGVVRQIRVYLLHSHPRTSWGIEDALPLYLPPEEVFETLLGGLGELAEFHIWQGRA